MRLRHGWLIALVIVARLATACGPGTVTPTPSAQATATSSPTTAPAAATSAATQETEPTPEPVSPAELPVDEGDWHVLGSADAAVTLIEYSDFQ